MKTITTLMNVSDLMAYREFDREAEPAPVVPFIASYTVSEVMEWLKITNIETMEPLELAVFEDRALLTDGNHRLVSAHKLGIKLVPVKVMYIETLDELGKMFYSQTIARFKKVN